MEDDMLRDRFGNEMGLEARPFLYPAAFRSLARVDAAAGD
jgi:hypothetical protein